MSIIEMRVPTIGESISEVTLSSWLKPNGEYVNLDEPICEFESDKATLEFPAEVAGKLIYVAEEGDDLEIGAIVAKIDTSAAPSANTPPLSSSTSTHNATKEVKPTAPSTASHASGHPSPSAAKLMKENDISSTTVAGTGKGGRITKNDVVKSLSNTGLKDGGSQSDNPSIISSHNFSREESRKKMSRMRRTIASRLVEAKNSTAMLTTFNEVDMTEIMLMRKKYQERFVEKYGIKLGFMSLFCKACSNVLMEMPDVNAFLDGNELIYHDYVDISVAISTENGLVVPPVKNVESLRFDQIEKAIKSLSIKAREGTLTLNEMKGGTFTVSNGGIFGSMMSTPILNRPQSAILGMHTIQQRPVAINGEVVIRPMMYLALSYDHRIIDGSTSVTFLVKVKKQLEEPMKLLMDL